MGKTAFDNYECMYIGLLGDSIKAACLSRRCRVNNQNYKTTATDCAKEFVSQVAQCPKSRHQTTAVHTAYEQRVGHYYGCGGGFGEQIPSHRRSKTAICKRYISQLDDWATGLPEPP